MKISNLMSKFFLQEKLINNAVHVVLRLIQFWEYVNDLS